MAIKPWQSCATSPHAMLKAELRSVIRDRKRQFTKQQLGQMSLAVVEKLLAHPRIIASHTILLYCSLPDEVDTRTVLERLCHKRVLLPKVTGDTTMELRLYTGPQDLEKGAFGIMEPTGTLFHDYESIDVAVVPGMAFDVQGHRLGRGRGYYDRLLAQMPNIYKIGVCFGFQLLETIPSEDTDISMDEVIC